MIHIDCRQPVAPRLVIADDGEYALILYCAHCEAAVNPADCDPPTPIIASVTPELVARLLATVHESKLKH